MIFTLSWEKLCQDDNLLETLVSVFLCSIVQLLVWCARDFFHKVDLFLGKRKAPEGAVFSNNSFLHSNHSDSYVCLVKLYVVLIVRFLGK